MSHFRLERKNDFHHNNDVILLIDGQERTSPDGKDYAEVNEMSELKSYTPIKKTFGNTPYEQLDKSHYEDPEVKHNEDSAGYLIPVLDKGTFFNF